MHPSRLESPNWETMSSGSCGNSANGPRLWPPRLDSVSPPASPRNSPSAIPVGPRRRNPSWPSYTVMSSRGVEGDSGREGSRVRPSAAVRPPLPNGWRRGRRSAGKRSRSWRTAQRGRDSTASTPGNCRLRGPLSGGRRRSRSGAHLSGRSLHPRPVGTAGCLGHNALYRDERNSINRIWQVVMRECPAAVVQARRYVLIAFLAFAVPAAAGFLLLKERPALAHELLPDVMLERAQAGASRIGQGKRYVEVEARQRPMIASSIITNNITVAFYCFAGGIFAGVGSLVLLA